MEDPSVSAPTAPRRFGTVGLYVQPPTAAQAHYLDFYKACGYNYLEFCEGGFAHRTDLLPGYHAEVADAIRQAQRKGFKVWILLLAGMKQWKGPEAAGGAGTFSALDAPELEERLGFIEQAVKALHGADGFEFFAGDPGGDPLGRSTVKDCIAFSQRVKEIVGRHAPRAGFALNLWAIAEWSGFPSPFSLAFWQKQVELSRAVAAEPGLLGPDCGVVFSMDNYYRSLTLTALADFGVEPEPYPKAVDVEALRRRKVKPVLGWPYFLVDECDDGFITPNNVVTGGQSQAETRYIRAIVDHGREVGLDGLVANASFVAAEALNIYAFGRMCREPAPAPGDLLDDWADMIADKATAPALGNVLRFVENQCNWQNSLPARYRIPDFQGFGLSNAAEAMALLDTVRARAAAPIPLPEPPPQVLARYRQRLQRIAAGDIGGPNPHYKPQR